MSVEKNITLSPSEEDNDEYYSIDDNIIDEILFSKEAIKEIVLYEKTIEIVGIIEHAEIKSNLLKFTLVNKKEDVIQILVWDENIILNIKNKIMAGNVIHIDGAFARLRNVTLSNGTIDFDLVIMSNTKVRLMKTSKYTTASISNSVIPVISIEDAVKHSSTIQVVGYIKNEIKEISLPNAKINQGCISDCEKYKIEIRMPALGNIEGFLLGSHVKITGVVKYAQHPYIWVSKTSDIVLQSNEKKKIGELLKGSKMPKRIMTDSITDSSNSSNKKTK